jgi:hypothetical protein
VFRYVARDELLLGHGLESGIEMKLRIDPQEQAPAFKGSSGRREASAASPFPT